MNRPIFISATTEFNTIEKNISAPYMRKNFVLRQKTKSAQLTVAVCGLYEFYINGINKTKGFLAPYRSNPEHYIFTDSYEISEHLIQGENVIAFVLGNGLQNSVVDTWDFDKSVWQSAPKLNFLLKIIYEDDSIEIIESDLDVKVAPSPIYFDDFHYGEYYDARNEIEGWNKPEFDDSKWDNAILAEKPSGEFCPCEAEPIVKRAERKPISITPFENGYIYDFGQNDAGLCQLIINGEKGQQIELRYFETLVDGKPYYENIRFNQEQLFQVDKYICSGIGTETYMPRFTYHGFRYVYVTGITQAQATEELLLYIVMSSDIKQIGEFTCDNDLINRIQNATLISDISNFYYFPTDCPQREKNGWTADASLSAEQMLLNYAPENSFKVWLKSIYKAMNKEGKLPGIIPTDSWGYEWGNGPAWDGVMINLPYYTYKYRGNKSIFEDLTIPLMRYIDYLYSKLNDVDLIGYGLGDWCQPDREWEGDYVTPIEVTDSILSMDIANKAAFVFEVMDMLPQKEYALRLSRRLLLAIRKNLLDIPKCLMRAETQTAQAMAIYYDIFTPEEKIRAVENLVNLIHKNNDLMDVGVLGGRVIFHVLADNGYAELAYKMIAGPEHPSYGNWFMRGATTLWEGFWKEDAKILSMNHHFWGDISSWFYMHLAGIKINPTAVDIKNINIEPCFISAVDNVKAIHKLPCGNVVVSWKRKDNTIIFELELPENCHGEIKLSNGYVDKNEKSVIKISGEKTKLIFMKKQM